MGSDSIGLNHCLYRCPGPEFGRILGWGGISFDSQSIERSICLMRISDRSRIVWHSNGISLNTILSELIRFDSNRMYKAASDRFVLSNAVGGGGFQGLAGVDWLRDGTFLGPATCNHLARPTSTFRYKPEMVQPFQLCILG